MFKFLVFEARYVFGKFITDICMKLIKYTWKFTVI